MSVKKLSQLFKEQTKSIAVAESCTGGLLSKVLTDTPGSSQYFKLGIVAYSNQAKRKLLSVSPKILRKYGAVSAQTAAQMATAVRKIAGVDIGLGITGIAGPSGGSKNKPVGTVFLALDTKKNGICLKYSFKGKREIIRKNAANLALNLIWEYLKK